MVGAFDPYEGWEDERTQPFARTARMRVLVAEDDHEMREMVGARLRRDGCEVVECASGDEAICVMKVIAEHESTQKDIELMVMDVRMPGMTGVDVLYQLRAWQWKTPILLMTAFPEPDLLDEAQRLGVSVLAKPFGLAKLSEAVRAAVGR